VGDPGFVVWAGLSAAAWRRQAHTTAPPDDIVRQAALPRVEYGPQADRVKPPDDRA
jgi:hypothetical protein